MAQLNEPEASSASTILPGSTILIISTRDTVNGIPGTEQHTESEFRTSTPPRLAKTSLGKFDILDFSRSSGAPAARVGVQSAYRRSGGASAIAGSKMRPERDASRLAVPP